MIVQCDYYRKKEEVAYVTVVMKGKALVLRANQGTGNQAEQTICKFLEIVSNLMDFDPSECFISYTLCYGEGPKVYFAKPNNGVWQQRPYRSCRFHVLPPSRRLCFCFG